MSQTFQKARFFLLHPEVNGGKVERLEALHREYVAYVRLCVQTMLDGRRLNLARSEKQAFFPRADKLSSQIEKNARDHAIQIVSAWAKSRYSVKVKGLITKAKKAVEITEAQAKSLYTVGKYLRNTPANGVLQADIDLYWKLLDEHCGKKPDVSNSLPMRLSEMTARLENPKEDGATLADLWLRASSLETRKSIWLPLKGSPYVSRADQVSKGILARKTKKGTWRFEAVEKKEWVAPEPSDLPPDSPRLGVDVGLNVLATTSNGDLYGTAFKPKFDRIHKKVRDLRANRMRQGLRENSPKLDRMESKLSGRIKTETGRIANDLVKKNPDTVFVLEDLDLSGCRGQKRFAYRALQRALSSKAPVEVVNPAYTSQECPSCGHISRGNRTGTKFQCRSCGRKAHADWVGASGVLRRSEDNDIGCKDHPSSVKATLRRRYLLRRNSPARSSSSEPSPLGRSLTTGVCAKAQTGTGSNLVPALPLWV
jgi:putative transposase